MPEKGLLVMIAVNIMVIWAITVHGHEMRTDITPL